MATRKVVVDYPAPGVMRATWDALTTNGDVGQVLNAVGWADKTVHVSGTYGTSGTPLIEGSNDETNYDTLTAADPATIDLSFTSGTNVKAILQNPLAIRPRLSDGTGTISISVIIVGYKSS